MQSGSYLHLAALRPWGRAEFLSGMSPCKASGINLLGLLFWQIQCTLPFVVVSAKKFPLLAIFPSLYFLVFPSFFEGQFSPFLHLQGFSFCPLFIASVSSSSLYSLSFLGSLWPPSASPPSPVWLCLPLQKEIHPFLPQPSKAICQTPATAGPPIFYVRHQKIKSEHRPSPQPCKSSSPKTDFLLLSLADTSKKEAAAFSAASSPLLLLK